jgi:hypothetical protein
MEQKIKRLSVSEATIAAVNAILYNGEGGKDFSAIINDLTAGSGRNRELIKMGIGLIERKIQVNVPSAPKTRQEEGKPSIKLTFKEYSVLFDVVVYTYEENGKTIEGRMEAAEWESLEVWQELAEMRPVDFSKKSTLRTAPKPYYSDREAEV